MSQRGTKVTAEYVWIGGSGLDLRSKAFELITPYHQACAHAHCRKVLDAPVKSASELPLWNFDGSSTGQAPGHDSEVIIKPIRVFPDPFRKGNNVLVLSECYKPEGNGVISPLSHLETEGTCGVNGNNSRFEALKVFSNPKVAEQKPWFGIEQEYILLDKEGHPLGFPKGGVAAPQGPYYCSIGANNAIGRQIAEDHVEACLYAGIQLSGINGEVFPGQWEFQVGPCEGIEAGDQLWMARYLLVRVAENHGVNVTFDPKPVKGDWNGSGCHTNYSTKDMRDPNIKFEYTGTFGPYSGVTLKGGFAKMVEGIERLGAPGKPMEHILVYGTGYKDRLTGAHETSRYDQFSYGVANRGASVRIPRDAEYNGYGYFEDRRPSGNMNPYHVTAKIAETTILG